jgi:hypothetical protein
MAVGHVGLDAEQRPVPRVDVLPSLRLHDLLREWGKCDGRRRRLVDRATVERRPVRLVEPPRDECGCNQ